MCETCTYQEVGEGKVKGYILVTECEQCRILRETQSIVYAKQNRKQEIINELDSLDKKAIRPLLDNELARVEEIKLQKNILRQELQSLGE
jgi:hypothetical protein